MTGPGGVNFDELRRMMLSFPGVEEGPSYGTPGFKLRGRFLARLADRRRKDPRGLGPDDVLVLKGVDEDEKAFLMGTQPETYFITDHYRGYPAVLIRLARIEAADLEALIGECWRRQAGKKLISAYEAARTRTPL